MSEGQVIDYNEYAITLGLKVCCLTIITHPIELAELLIQVGYSPIPGYPKRSILGVRNCFKYIGHINERDGSLGVYRGLFSNIRAKVVSFVIKEAVYLELKSPEDDVVEQENVDFRTRLSQFGITFLKDIVQKTASVIVSQPFYVMTWRIMGEFVGKEELYSGFLASLEEIYRREGATGFFVGLEPRLIGEMASLILFNTITFVLNTFLVTDPVLKALDKVMFQFICNGFAYPFLVTSMCYGVNDCGLACGLPPYMPKFNGWLDAWHHVCKVGRIYKD